MRRKTRKETKIKFYKVVVTPTLLCGSEAWARRKQEDNRIQAKAMRFLRAVEGCSREDE
jgi:hypothetical protein